MAMSLNFRRFHSAVIVLAAFAAGSVNAQNNIRNMTIYYSNSVPNARAVLLVTEKSDGSEGPGRTCTQLLNNNNPQVTVMTGYIYHFSAWSSTNCAPATNMAGLTATYVGLTAGPRGIEVKLDANGFTAYDR